MSIAEQLPEGLEPEDIMEYEAPPKSLCKSPKRHSRPRKLKFDKPKYVEEEEPQDDQKKEYEEIYLTSRPIAKHKHQDQEQDIAPQPKPKKKVKDLLKAQEAKSDARLAMIEDNINQLAQALTQPKEKKERKTRKPRKPRQETETETESEEETGEEEYERKKNSRRKPILNDRPLARRKGRKPIRQRGTGRPQRQIRSVPSTLDSLLHNMASINI